jgi:hypothetical protein
VTNRVFDLNFVKDSAVIELNEESVADRTLLGVMVFDAETLVFNTVHLGTEGIDTRISGRGVSAGREVRKTVSICENCKTY